jgi:trimeric autotransporter adhesin
MSHRRVPSWAIALVIAVPAFTAGVGITAAASTSSSKTFYACLKSGTLTKVSAKSHGCSAGQTMVDWNAEGAPGPTGATGRSGSTGAKGAAGATGPSGPPASCASVPHEGVQYAGCSLVGANFSQDDLQDASFAGANLTYADFGTTSLIDANLEGANLTGAGVGCEPANSTTAPAGQSTQVTGANLSGAILTGSCWQGLLGAPASVPSGYEFVSVACTVNFCGSIVGPAINLTYDYLEGADLANLNLSDSNLTGADLTGADMTGTTLTGATWSGTTCPDGSDSDDDSGTCVNNGA